MRYLHPIIILLLATATGFFSETLAFNDFIVRPQQEMVIDSRDLENITLSIDPEKYSSISINPELDSETAVHASFDGVTYPVKVNVADDKLCVILNIQRDDPIPPSYYNDDSLNEWQIHIPEGFFRIDFKTMELQALPYPMETLQNMDTPGAWHIAGQPWSHEGLFSIHDDDLMDRYVPSSGYSKWMQGGYQSILYPLLESLGLRASLAVEGQRCGMTANPPVINLNGRTAIRLQNEKGWELMAHSMTARYDYVNYFVESLESDLANTILKKGKYSGLNSNNTTSVYDAETGKQYSVNADLTGWTETPTEYIKCYVRDYATGKLKMYNPAFPIDYQWGEMARLAPEFGFDIKAWVTPAETSSHANLPLINDIFPYGFANFEHEGCNVPPLRSAATRIPIEGLWLSGYKGEQDADNRFNQEHYEYFKGFIDEAAEKGGWIIFALHAYRPCWVNKLPGALVSEGGDYPDEWVLPLRDIQQYPETYIEPPVEKGIQQWSDWTPCPGTRLHMLWQLLKYAKEKGLLNVTSSEGFQIIGNRVNKGFYDGGSWLVNDKNGIDGSTGNYSHFVIGANDEASYYHHALSDAMTLEFKENRTHYIGCEYTRPLRVYAIDGTHRVVRSLDELPKGLWIVNGSKVVKR